MAVASCRKRIKPCAARGHLTTELLSPLPSWLFGTFTAEAASATVSGVTRCAKLSEDRASMRGGCFSNALRGVVGTGPLAWHAPAMAPLNGVAFADNVAAESVDGRRAPAPR